MRIDLGQLYQVLINLTANARDAMRDGGELLVATGTRDRPGGASASIVVSDTGVGMRPEVLRRAFEPFFTTKEVGSGTELGLSIVYGIVQGAGGTILITSEPDRGTRVEVHLPLVDEPETLVRGSAALAAAGRGRILLVEDDEVVRALSHRALEEAGYDVVTASDGEEAREILGRDRSGWDLVVTDVVMPRLGGRGLGRWIAAHLPDVPVLYTSGYPGEDAAVQSESDTPRGFLAKPFTPEALVQRVRGEMERARSD